MTRLLSWCLVASAPFTSATSQHNLVRIPLESDNHLRFTGSVHVDSSPQPARVVFDTGSSDVWVARDFAGGGREHFAIGYGGGIVSGLARRADLRLLGSDENDLVLRDVHLGLVHDQAKVFSGLDAHGVVGFGMEALAQINANSSLLGLLGQQSVLPKPIGFSLFISSSLGAQPSSQLILGADVDPALTSLGSTWFSFPVVSNSAFRGPQPPSSSTRATFGFWAVQVQRLCFDNVLLPIEDPDKRQTIALLDSGTSLLLLPPHIFDDVIRALFDRFGTRFLPPGKQRSLPACRLCRGDEFPPLAVNFLQDDDHNPDSTSQRFVLRCSDYVRCDQRRRECTAMIDSIHSSEIHSELDVVVLGTIFFRAYYTRFDYTHKKVSIACTVDENGECPGGVQPALDYRGRPHKPFSKATESGFIGIAAAVTALALLAGFQMLLQLVKSPLCSNEQLKQHSVHKGVR